MFINQNTQVHWKCTWIGVHQAHKLQWSSKSKRLEHEKELKTELQSSKRVEERFNLEDRLFLSLKASTVPFSPYTHKTQFGTALHKSTLHCLPKEPCQAINKSITLCGITQFTPKRAHTIDIAQKQWDNEEEDDLSIPCSFYTYNTKPWQGHPYSIIYQESKSYLKR